MICDFDILNDTEQVVLIESCARKQITQQRAASLVKFGFIKNIPLALTNFNISLVTRDDIRSLYRRVRESQRKIHLLFGISERFLSRTFNRSIGWYLRIKSIYAYT